MSVYTYINCISLSVAVAIPTAFLYRYVRIRYVCYRPLISPPPKKDVVSLLLRRESLSLLLLESSSQREVPSAVVSLGYRT